MQSQSSPTSTDLFTHNVAATDVVADTGYTPRQIMAGGIVLMVVLTASLVFGTSTFGFGGDHSEQAADAPSSLAAPAVGTQSEMSPASPVSGSKSSSQSGAAQGSSQSSRNSTSVIYESHSVSSSDPSENQQTSRLVVDGVEQPVSSSPSGDVNQTIQKTEGNSSVTIQINTSSSSSSGGQTGGGN